MISAFVFKQYIIFWVILLYKRAFEYKRFVFAVTEDIVKVIYVFYHFLDLFLMVLVRTEVLAYSIFQRFCLADIYYLAGLVLHEINARLKRQRHGFFTQYFYFFIHMQILCKNISKLHFAVLLPSCQVYHTY